MKFKILLAGLVLLASSFVLPQSNSVSFDWVWRNAVDPDGVPQSFEFPAFDPSIGTLTDIEVTIRCNSSSDLKGESVTPWPSTLNATASFLGAIALSTDVNPDLGLFAIATQRYSRNESHSVGAFDGVVDYDGASGFSFPVIFKRSRYVTYHVDPSLWSNFISSNGSVVMYCLRNDLGVNLDVSGAAFQDIKSLVGGNGTVTYHFQ